MLFYVLIFKDLKQSKIENRGLDLYVTENVSFHVKSTKPVCILSYIFQRRYFAFYLNFYHCKSESLQFHTNLIFFKKVNGTMLNYSFDSKPIPN